MPAIAAEIQEGEGRIVSPYEAVALAAALGVSGALFARRVTRLTQLVSSARPTARSGDVPARVRNEVTIVLGQRKLLQRLGPGLMHAFIFWGFLVLAPTILIAMIAIVDRHQTLPWLGHQGWYALIVDIFLRAGAGRCQLSAVGAQGGAAEAEPTAATWVRRI